MELVNLTPYAVERAIGMDGDGRETLLVAVKATFALTAGGKDDLVLAEEQPPLVMADEYSGEPGLSSISRASEMAPFKPGADLLVHGCAYPSRERDAETQVVFSVGRLQKAVWVTGDRAWEGSRGAPSRPIPLARMPLVYERAFGGRDDSPGTPDACAENPVGVGFRAARSRLPVAGARLPNLEDPAQPMRAPDDRPAPRGLGPIAPSWSPRPRYAGTYDAAWQRQRLPLLPQDFDPRFHQAAPADQVLPGYLAGGEPVAITSVRPGGRGFQFSVPALRPAVVVRVGQQRETPPAPCDMLILDCEAALLSLVFRASLPIQGRLADLAWIKIEEPAGAA